MSDPGDEGRQPAGELAVDITPDRRARVILVAFLAGPVIWLVHFIVVYLVTEAGCTGGGPGLRALNPPVPGIVTLVATVVAAAGCLATAGWAYHRWRGGDPVPTDDGPGRPAVEEHARSLAFTGFLLACLSVLAVLAVGAPALFLSGC